MTVLPFGARGLCAAALIAAAASSMLGVYALGSLRAGYAALRAEAGEASALKAAADSREATLARCKTLASGGGEELPVRPESANKFYSALLAALAANGLEGARITQASAPEGEAAFSVSGMADYGALRAFAASLSTGRYLARLDKMALDGGAAGEIAYLMEISTRLADGGER